MKVFIYDTYEDITYELTHVPTQFPRIGETIEFESSKSRGKILNIVHQYPSGDIVLEI